MSHHNFNATKFACDIMSSFYECGKTEDASSAIKNADIKDIVVKFIGEIENIIDNSLVEGNSHVHPVFSYALRSIIEKPVNIFEIPSSRGYGDTRPDNEK